MDNAPNYLIECIIQKENTVIYLFLFFRAESIYRQLAKSPYVSNAARRVLHLPLITENHLKASGSSSMAMPIHQNGISPRRRRHQSSGNSGESLNNSSSVEVLSEMDDETKVENRLMATGNF